MDLSGRAAGEDPPVSSPRFPVGLLSSSQISGEGGEAVMDRSYSLILGGVSLQSLEPPGSGMQQVLSSARWSAEPGLGGSRPSG